MSTANGEKVIVIDIALDEDNNLQKVTEDAITEVGFIKPYAGASVPTGYLLCNGAAISRAQYPELFAAIGTTWGAGDGSSTFNVPDLRGYFLRGVGGGQAAALGAAQTEAIDWHRLQFMMGRPTNPKDNSVWSYTISNPSVDAYGVEGIVGTGNNFIPSNLNISTWYSTEHPNGVRGITLGCTGDGKNINANIDPWKEVEEKGGRVIALDAASAWLYRDTETRPMNKAVNYCLRYA